MPFNYIGEYDNGYDYTWDDAVTYSGSLWIRTGEPNPGYPPYVGSPYWTLLVSAGEQGPTGPAGADGVMGVDGATGPTGPSGLLTATSPIVYNDISKDVSLDQSALEDILDIIYIRIDGIIDGGTP
jgi:hypothetical protein